MMRLHAKKWQQLLEEYQKNKLTNYHAVAKKYGCDNAMFYADMAKAFLFDKDAGTPREKLSAYYHGIAKKE